MARRTGTVWFGNRLVGRIREDEGRNILFAYDEGWLDGTGFPVSISLPLSILDEEVDAHAWFTGLLPEGDAKLLACRMSGVRQSDPMGLLLACGADCAGALSILPSEEYMSATAEAPRELSVDEIISLVNSSGKVMPTFPGGGVRFSLSGAQQKLAVIYDDGTYFLSTRSSPSSHILKFETLPGVCFAESIANAIARETGLLAVETQFLQIGDGDSQPPWLRISRYDRVRDQDGNLVRVHQEDMAQALRLHNFEKYQSDQYDYGPSIHKVANFLRSHAAEPVTALSTVLDWQILNCLLGNWDGHAKNLSLLYHSGQRVPVLAPSYDMVSIEYLNQFQPDYYAREMGLAVGGNVRLERITRKDWEQMAVDMGMPIKKVLSSLEEKATILPDVTDRVLAEFIARHGGKDDYEQLLNVVGAHCRHVLNSVFRCGVTKTDQDLVTETKPDTESRKSSP